MNFSCLFLFNIPQCVSNSPREEWEKRRVKDRICICGGVFRCLSVIISAMLHMPSVSF